MNKNGIKNIPLKVFPIYKYTCHILCPPSLPLKTGALDLSDSGGVLSSDSTPGHEHVPVGEEQRHCSGTQ